MLIDLTKEDLTAAHIRVLTETVQTLPYDMREQLHEAISLILVKADRETAKIRRLEKSLTRYMSLQWTKRANKAVNAALSVLSDSEAKVTAAQTKKILNKLRTGFNNVEAAMSPRVRADMEETYRTAKSRFVATIKNKRRRAKLLHPISKANATKVNKANITIDEIDELTWDQLSKLTLLSTAKRYPAMEPVIEKLLKEGILDREYNQRQAAELLRRELTRKLGATALKGVDREVIEAGQESTTAFFKGLTQTNMNYAENFANVTAMDEAQIDRYVITAIIDNLTSDICQSMDGRTFEVVRAVEYRDRILAAESVEEVKGVAPWRKDLSEFGLKKGEKLTDAKTSDALAQAGLALPPYHFRCRTLVFPA